MSCEGRRLFIFTRSCFFENLCEEHELNVHADETNTSAPFWVLFNSNLNTQMLGLSYVALKIFLYIKRDNRCYLT